MIEVAVNITVDKQAAIITVQPTVIDWCLSRLKRDGVKKLSYPQGL